MIKELHGCSALDGHVVAVGSQEDVWCLPKPRMQGPLRCLCACSPLHRVKLLTGSLSHENPGNQFGHLAPIFTIILLAITAVLQIICLNRGLKVYDSTLVVPVFYGVYTATGCAFAFPLVKTIQF